MTIAHYLKCIIIRNRGLKNKSQRVYFSAVPSGRLHVLCKKFIAFSHLVKTVTGYQSYKKIVN